MGSSTPHITTHLANAAHRRAASHEEIVLHSQPANVSDYSGLEDSVLLQMLRGRFLSIRGSRLEWLRRLYLSDEAVKNLPTPTPEVMVGDFQRIE